MKFNRRQFVLASASAGALASAAVGKTKKAAPPPNIIFIMADDMGYADVGVYGQRHLDTPHIDSMARDGLMLTNGYASSCFCSPTRTALATGCYQQRFALGLQEPLVQSSPPNSGLPHTQTTIASALRDVGYQTALVGKWHLGEPPEHGPLRHGYDSHFGIIQGSADYFSHRADLKGEIKIDGLYRNESPAKQQGYLTDLLGDEAVRLVENAGPKPLFLSLHFTAPHWPWEGPDDEEVSKNLKDMFHRDGGTLETYAAMIRSMDANIGKVLAALKRKRMADNTIVVFTSDNGGERFSDTWPFTGVKGELLEGGIRVPLLVKWPKRIAKGKISKQVMASMDFMPTFVSAAGGTAISGLDGMDLLPVLTGAEAARERTLFWRFKGNDQAAVRQGDWKYLQLGKKEHLFNVANDPRERARLNDLYPDKLTELKRLYVEWNEQMLPYPEQSQTADVKRTFPDRY